MKMKMKILGVAYGENYLYGVYELVGEKGKGFMMSYKQKDDKQFTLWGMNVSFDIPNEDRIQFGNTAEMLLIDYTNKHGITNKIIPAYNDY